MQDDHKSVSHIVATVLLYRSYNFITLYYKIVKFQYNEWVQ